MPTESMLSDILTKPVDKKIFRKLQSQLLGHLIVRHYESKLSYMFMWNSLNLFVICISLVRSKNVQESLCANVRNSISDVISTHGPNFKTINIRRFSRVSIQRPANRHIYAMQVYTPISVR